VNVELFAHSEPGWGSLLACKLTERRACANHLLRVRSSNSVPPGVELEGDFGSHVLQLEGYRV